MTQSSRRFCAGIDYSKNQMFYLKIASCSRCLIRSSSEETTMVLHYDPQKVCAEDLVKDHKGMSSLDYHSREELYFTDIIAIDGVGYKYDDRACWDIKWAFKGEFMMYIETMYIQHIEHI